MKKIFLILTASILISANSQASILFSDNFESGLGQWTAGNAQIVNDPTSSGNQVLSFSSLNSAGDIFSSNALFSTNSNQFTLSFDYYGTNNNSGGFIGFSQNFPGNHVWLAGSDTNYSGTTLWQNNLANPLSSRILIGDNSWNSYEFTFTSNINPLHIMLEDFVGADNIAGNAYFDNIVLTDAITAVPEPSILALLSFGLIGVSFINRKRKVKK